MAAIGEFLQNPLARVSCCSIQYDLHFDSPFPGGLLPHNWEDNACDNTYMSVATRIWIHGITTKRIFHGVWGLIAAAGGFYTCPALYALTFGPGCGG
jgi:hypothetical protein